MKFLSTLASAIFLSVCLLVAPGARAQNFTLLYAFGGTYDPVSQTRTNMQGLNPYSGLTAVGNTLYGTTAFSSGTNPGGTVFKINTDGTSFSTLYTFSNYVNGTNSDGFTPYSGLLLAGNTLYGTTISGGLGGNGVVFAINTDGTGFTNLHNFSGSHFLSGIQTNSDGNQPEGTLILSGNTLYGTAEYGGAHQYGTVFALNTDGTGFTVLHAFSGTDGGWPRSALVLNNGTLYGTAAGGGTGSGGTIFKVNIDGTGFQTVHNFAYGTYGADGENPISGLVFLNNVLYGTTTAQGSHSDGQVFKINTDGTGFVALHNFAGTDGYQPVGGMILAGTTLYGTTSAGGTNAQGEVFKINTDGTGFTGLYNFTNGADGRNIYAGVIMVGNVLYGTAYNSAVGQPTGGAGTVFALTTTFAPIPLNYQWINNNVILSWTNASFSLQSAPLVTGTFTSVPSATSPFTNVITGAQLFFRLSFP